jgi:hypothetical protein
LLIFSRRQAVRWVYRLFGQKQEIWSHLEPKFCSKLRHKTSHWKSTGSRVPRSLK